jgi:hypothetical protein
VTAQAEGGIVDAEVAGAVVSPPVLEVDESPSVPGATPELPEHAAATTTATVRLATPRYLAMSGRG